MSILIKGTKMPENCIRCPCYNDEIDICNITLQPIVIEEWHKRRADCPLIGLPDIYIDIAKAFMTELTDKVCIKGDEE